MSSAVGRLVKLVGALALAGGLFGCGGGESASVSVSAPGASAVVAAADAGSTESAEAQAGTPPARVRLLEVSSSQPGQMSVSWLPTQDDDTPAAQIRYQIHASTEGLNFKPGAETLKFEGQGADAALVTRGLTAGETYAVKVVALDAGGARSVSKPLRVKVAQVEAKARADAKVLNLTADDVASITPNAMVLVDDARVPTVGMFVSYLNLARGTSFLREVTKVSRVKGQVHIQTVPATLAQVMEDSEFSSTVKMESVPAALAEQAVRSGRAKVLAQAAGENAGSGGVEHDFSWPKTGLRYVTDVQPELAEASGSRFSANTPAPVSGNYFYITGMSQVYLNEGENGTVRLTMAINDRTETDPAKAISICRADVGVVSNDDSDAPAGYKSRVKVARQSWIVKDEKGSQQRTIYSDFSFEAKKLTAADKPYTVKVKVFADTVKDRCNSNGKGWKEQLEFQFKIYVTSDTFPKSEKLTTTFSGSGGIKVKNEIDFDFSPELIFDQTTKGATLEKALFKVQAGPEIKQKLTVTASAAGTLNENKKIFSRKFMKIYMTPSGIPILLRGDFSVDMRVKGSVTGKINATEQLEVGFDEISAGFEYTSAGGFRPVSTIRPVYSLKIGGKGRAEANVEVFLTPSVSITLYEVTTGRLVLDPYVKATAGVEGYVQIDHAIDFDELQSDLSLDADFRLTKGYLSAGLNAWVYADLHWGDRKFLVYPEGANEKNYFTYQKIELVGRTKLMEIPTLAGAADWDTAAVLPSDSRAVKVVATATELPNPLKSVFTGLPASYITWAAWSAPRVIAPAGVAANSYALLPDPDGTPGVYWLRATVPGVYTVRVGGHSSLGTWARQYQDITVDVRDRNGNGIPDFWEERYGLSNGTADADGDGRTNLQEWQQGTDPLVADATANGLVIVSVQDNVGDVTGALAPNASTDDATPTLSGVVGSGVLSSGRSVRVMDGSTVLGQAVMSGTTWQFTPAQALSLGSHALKAVVVNASGGSVAVSNVWGLTVVQPTVTPTGSGKLPDTGIPATACYGRGSDELVSCTSSAAKALNTSQDGMVGRDVTEPSAANGKLGFNYTKISSTGAALPASATNWDCVKDNITGLMWEVKTADGGLRDMSNTYTNYGTNQSGDAAEFVAQVNAAGLCGKKDWRLPTAAELLNLVDFSASYTGNPTIDSVFFPNTQTSYHWTSSPVVGDSDYAWFVDFYNGNVSYGNRYVNSHVRLVR